MTVGIIRDTVSSSYFTASGVDLTYDITGIHLEDGGKKGRKRLQELHSARADLCPQRTTLNRSNRDLLGSRSPILFCLKIIRYNLSPSFSLFLL